MINSKCPLICSKVVLINQSTSYLMVDIVNAYCRKYDEVTLITGHVKIYDRRLCDKVKLTSIISYNKSSIIQRFFTWIIGFIQLLFILYFRHRHATVIYVTNPPLSYFAALLLRNRFAIIEYDIYPDALKNIGIHSNNYIFKVWTAINKKVFKKAECIYTLSEGMANLLSKYVERRKIMVIPNWSSIENLYPISKTNNFFIKEYSLEGKFVIMYSGNIGYTHNVEIIMELAKRLRQEQDIHFVIIGNGGKKDILMNIAKLESLTNCTFLDWQPVNKIPYSLSAADLSIITLTADTALVSVPSKTYNLLSVGSPLLCIAPQNSEIAMLVEKENCGKCYDKKEIDKMIAFIMQLRMNEEYRKELVRNSQRASLSYTYKNADMYVIEK